MTQTSDPTAERRDEVVKRMLATPPQKHRTKSETGEPASDKVSGKERSKSRD